MGSYDNIKRKIIILCPKNSHGEELLEVISNSGVTKIPEPHTIEFENTITGAEFFKGLKNEEYIENLRECLAANCNLEGFVIKVSLTFFNTPRERLGNKDKNKAVDSWLKIFGNKATFIYLDVKNFAYRVVNFTSKDKGIEGLLEAKKITPETLEFNYKHYIRKEEENWSTNNFEHRGQIVCVKAEDLIENDEETWNDLEEHIDLKLAKRDIGVDIDKFQEHYRISMENLSMLNKLRKV